MNLQMFPRTASDFAPLHCQSIYNSTSHSTSLLFKETPQYEQIGIDVFGNKKQYSRKGKARRSNLTPPSSASSSFSSISHKKTHLLKFRFGYNKRSKPKLLLSQAIVHSNVIRFGNFSGVRDYRAVYCPLRGIRHGMFIKPGLRCPCQCFTIYPSPLNQLNT